VIARQILLLVGALVWPNLARAEDNLAQGIDSFINQRMQPVADGITSVVFFAVPVNGTDLPLILVWLVVGGSFFTLYFGFINIRGFRHAVDLMLGRYSDPKHPGEVSHFQALATALSGTAGLGNIAGVAVAVSLGGPGATFWMILAGFLGMSSKFAECVLAVKYRNVNPDGSVSGGPMYYLSKGLAEKNMPGLGRFLALFFAIMCIGGSLGAGNMFQANQAFEQFRGVTGGDAGFFADKGWLFGLVIAVLVGIVIIGGIKSIARVTARLVPFMIFIYVGAALVIIVAHADQLPSAINAIVSGAFSPDGVTGGVVGVLIQGFRRAAFSNEAGVGSAPIAHAAVRTNEPVTEGMVSLLEPFIDTVVICTMTALVIVLTGTYDQSNEGMEGVAMTSAAFESTISWFPYVLAAAVILFAFSTMISWSYYGAKSWTYLFGESRAADLTYKTMFCVFVVVGSSTNLSAVIDFSDSMLFAMSLANILGLYILAPVIRKEYNSYWARLRSGEIRRTRGRTISDN
jgi:alanine or glycine:cation symporter, AGCS family